jgi:hypothetical protein
MKRKKSKHISVEYHQVTKELQNMMKGTKKQTPINKMVIVNSYIAVNTLSALNTPIKRHRMAEQIRKYKA